MASSSVLLPLRTSCLSRFLRTYRLVWHNVCSGRKPTMASDRSFVVSSAVCRGARFIPSPCWTDEQSEYVRSVARSGRTACLVLSTATVSTWAKSSARCFLTADRHCLAKERFADRNLLLRPLGTLDEYSNGSGNETPDAGRCLLCDRKPDLMCRLRISRSASPFAQS